MSTLTVGTISEKVTDAGVAVDGVTLKDGALGTTASPVAIHSSSLNGGQFGGRRNMIINGAMQIAQRGTSSTGVGAADGYFTLDRWYCDTNGNSAGRLTMTQTAITDLPGFQNCLKFACTTADTSIAATERFRLEYKMEGFDAQGLAKGTSDTKPVTVSFYVKGHDSATYTVGLYEGTTGRKIAATFPVTTSWVRQTVTFPGDTTGVIPNNNTAQLMLRFYLHAGSNYTSGTLGTSWNDDGNTVQISSDGNSIFESTSAEFFLTGVQMEIGEQATPFEHRSFGEELALCQRYFQKYSDNGSGSGYVANGNIQSQRFYGIIRWTTTMRAIPTVAGTSGDFAVQSSANSASGYSIDEQHNPTVDSVRLRTGSNSNLTNGQGALLKFGEAGSLTADSEL